MNTDEKEIFLAALTGLVSDPDITIKDAVNLARDAVKETFDSGLKPNYSMRNTTKLTTKD